MNINPYESPSKDEDETEERIRDKQFRVSFSFIALSLLLGTTSGTISTNLIFWQFWRTRNENVYPPLPYLVAGAIAGLLVGAIYVHLVNISVRKRIKKIKLSESKTSSDSA